MKIYELEKPVLDKIEKVVNQAITDGKIPAGQVIKFLDFEPDEGFLQSRDLDGAIAVHAGPINFPSGSTTGTQESDNRLTVDSYGFGDPVPNPEEPLILDPTVRQSKLRAQVLTTLIYKAIMDRQEIAGNLDGSLPRDFGTDINTGNKMPESITPFSPVGSMNSGRSVSVIRSVYNFKDIEEDAPEEPLGVPYLGSDDIDSPTYDPGSEPGEGV